MSAEIYFLLGFASGCCVTYTILNIQLRDYKKMLNEIIEILNKEIEK